MNCNLPGTWPSLSAQNQGHWSDWSHNGEKASQWTSALMSDQELIPGKIPEHQGRALGHGDGEGEPPSQPAEPLSAGRIPDSNRAAPIACNWLGFSSSPPPKHSNAVNGTTRAEEVTCRLEAGPGRHLPVWFWDWFLRHSSPSGSCLTHMFNYPVPPLPPSNLTKSQFLL